MSTSSRIVAFLKTSLVPFALVLAVVLAGCGTPEPATGSIIVGLTSELRVPTDIQELHVVMRVNGAVVLDDTRGSFSGAMQSLSFPSELPFKGLQDGDQVEVELEAFGGGALRVLLISRRAVTQVVGGETLLFRVRLETECAPVAGEAIECQAPQTCITGTCREAFVDPYSLERYTPTWSQVSNDICKPVGGGDPIVIVGKGQSDYLPMDDLEVAQVEAGPQGGHHIWVAIRTKNLRQSGSITSVSGYVPELDVDLSPFNVIFTFDPDEGGYCKLYGLRYQLDGDGHAIDSLLGHTVKVKVTVTESKDGAVGVGERTVKLSDTIL
jgi:hypothetical protein